MARSSDKSPAVESVESTCLSKSATLRSKKAGGAIPSPGTKPTLSSTPLILNQTLLRPESSSKTMAEYEVEGLEADDATLAGRSSDEEAHIVSINEISSTISLASSATRYKYENGRRYHAQADIAQYFLPNDDAEDDRLDLLHHILTLRCDDKPKEILDLGTGSGIWAIEMGDAYLSAIVIGNDLSPVQPNVVPLNVLFEADDIEAEWCYSSRFDYMHCRYLAGSIGDWPRLMKQAFKYTKPGGWVEFQDFDMHFYSMDGTFILGCAADERSKEIVLALNTLGREPSPGPKLEKLVGDAGFVNLNY